jgi:hypothetical protein
MVLFLSGVVVEQKSFADHRSARGREAGLLQTRRGEGFNPVDVFVWSDFFGLWLLI